MLHIGVIYLGRRGAGGLISVNMAVSLAEHAHVFGVLSSHAESLPTWQKSGLEHFTVPTYQSLYSALWSWIDRRQMKQTARQIRDHKPNILLFPMFYTLNPLLQKYLSGIPSVVAVHDPIPHVGLIGKLYQFLEDYSIRQASQCLVFSQAFLDVMHKQRGVPSDRLAKVSLGELGYLTPSDQCGAFKDASKKNPFTLLFFGRITGYKGLEILLKAYAIVSRDLPLRLFVVGSGNLRPYRSLLKEIDEVEIVNHWIPESEIWQYFSQSDLVVLPYTSATQSGIIPIAACYALPVIATRVGGLPEQIEDGRSGLLIEPASVDDLVQAIRKLVTQPEFAHGLGVALQQKFQGELSWGKSASQIISICKKLV